MRSTFSREAAALFFVLMALYGTTLSRYVGPADSAEFTVALSTWGVPHAPGFPLFCLLGNLLTHALPWLDAALLLNIANAAVAALVCAVVGFAVANMTGRNGAGFVAGLALGTSRIFWHEALTLEVFALAALMAALLLYLESRFFVGEEGHWETGWTMPAGILVLTTTLTHHATLALIGVPVLAVMLGVIVSRSSRPGPRPSLRPLVVRCAFALAIGLLPLAYVPLAGRADPPVNWGDVYGWDGLVSLQLRKDYGTGTLQSPGNVVSEVLTHGEGASPLEWRNYRMFWADLPRSFGWWFLPLPLLGLFYAARSARPHLWQSLLFLVVLTLFFARVNTPQTPLFRAITERFFVLPHLMLAFYAGLGIAQLEHWVGLRRREGMVMLTVLIVLAGPWAIARNGRAVDQHDNHFTRDFGHNLLAGVPQGALYLSTGDLFHHSLLYQQACLGQRSDVAVVNQDALALLPWYAAQVRRRQVMRLPDAPSGAGESSAQWLDANADAAGVATGRPVVAVMLTDDSYASRYRLLPLSMWSRVLSARQKVDLAKWHRASEQILGGWEVGQLERTYPEETWEGHEQVFYDYALGQFQGLRDVLLLQDPDKRFETLPALERTDRWSGRRKASLIAMRADFIRACAEDSTIALASGERQRLVTLALRLAGESLALDSIQVQALQTRAAIQSASAADRHEELATRAKIVEQRPGDTAELTPYFRLAANIAREGAPDRERVIEEARRVHARFVRLLDIAVRIDRSSNAAAFRDHWIRAFQDVPASR